jgi:hypothetical protein
MSFAPPLRSTTSILKNLRRRLHVLGYRVSTGFENPKLLNRSNRHWKSSQKIFMALSACRPLDDDDVAKGFSDVSKFFLLWVDVIVT